MRRGLKICSLLALLLLCRAAPAACQTEEPVPARIVALYGAFSDILLDLGAGDKLVGRTLADTRPELAHLPVVGTHMRPNVELIAALKPDVIFQFQSRGESEAQAAQLRTLGFRVVTFQPSSFQDLKETILEMGRIVGKAEKAAELWAGLQARLDAVAERRVGKPRPSIFFEIRWPNLLAAGTGSMASAVIEAAGARNVVQLPDRVARLSEEELIRLDPDIYMVQQGPMNSQLVHPEARPHYRSLRAVARHRVITVDENMFSRPAPDAVKAVEQLADQLDSLNSTGVLGDYLNAPNAINTKETGTAGNTGGKP